MSREGCEMRDARARARARARVCVCVCEESGLLLRDLLCSDGNWLQGTDGILTLVRDKEEVLGHKGYGPQSGGPNLLSLPLPSPPL